MTSPYYQERASEVFQWSALTLCSYSVVSLVLKHQCDIKEGCEQGNVLASMSLSYLAVILQTDLFLLPPLRKDSQRYPYLGQGS